MNGLLTAKEAANRLKVHPNTVYLYLEQGKLRGFKVIGKRWRIKEADLEAFINGRKEK
jgi:excisionase family DNA binding protein